MTQMIGHSMVWSFSIVYYKNNEGLTCVPTFKSIKQTQQWQSICALRLL